MITTINVLEPSLGTFAPRTFSDAVVRNYFSGFTFSSWKIR